MRSRRPRPANACCAPWGRIEQVELAALTAFRDKPADKIRITAPELAAETVLWPALQRLLPDYPDISVEIVSSDVRTNIVAERFDAGVRIGEYVEKDIVAVCITPPGRMAAVGTPAYFKGRPKPRKPEDLRATSASTWRASRGDLFPWEFERAGREVAVKVDGQLAFTNLHLIRNAALAGLGLAYLPEQGGLADVAEGRLVRVLEN